MNVLIVVLFNPSDSVFICCMIFLVYFLHSVMRNYHMHFSALVFKNLLIFQTIDLKTPCDRKSLT